MEILLLIMHQELPLLVEDEVLVLQAQQVGRGLQIITLVMVVQENLIQLQTVQLQFIMLVVVVEVADTTILHHLLVLQEGKVVEVLGQEMLLLPQLLDKQIKVDH